MDSAPISFKPRPRNSAGAPIAPPTAQQPPQPPTLASIRTSGASTVLRVEDMTCGSCANRVQGALTKVPGVAFARVELDQARAVVEWTAGSTPKPDALIEAARAAGYAASLIASDAPPTSGESSAEQAWRRAVGLGVPILVAMMIAEWGLGLGMDPRYRIAALILALPVQVWVGAGFYRGAWRLLQVGGSNMDTLVALGSTAAFGFSVWIVASGTPGHAFFMESVGILTLISLGHWMEARMSARAGASLRALLTLAPATARLRISTSSPAPAEEREVPVASLNRGDVIVLRPGDRVPVDAVVLEGESSVDESMLTGESVPVEKASGATLYSGTVNASGRLVARVEATGSATALAHIVAAVQRAQSSRAGIQRLADQISAVFVPVVVAIAVIAALGWGLAFGSASALQADLSRWLWHAHAPESPLAAAFMVFASVLIVACPCAMGLATPAALMAGVNAAARHGILIRDAVALEKSGKIQTVVFDKTGTLTEGRPVVIARQFVEGTSASNRAELDALAIQLARPSSHPVSRSIAESSTPSANTVIAPPLTGWREVRGSGVEARNGSVPVRLGSAGWMRELGLDLTALEPFSAEHSATGATMLYLATGDRVAGAYALRDALKPGAREVVQRLRNSGYRVRILSGDQPRAVAAIASELGLNADDVTAGVRPEQKAAAIEALQQRGERVAFVGDGLNDGPALARADLGIAVSRATDVAREAADVVLLRPDLAAVPDALELSRQTLRVIHQNLFWAFFYNAAFVPLAALGMFSPLLSAVAMGASDVMVIGNALRLARKR